MTLNKRPLIQHVFLIFFCLGLFSLYSSNTLAAPPTPSIDPFHQIYIFTQLETDSDIQKQLTPQQMIDLISTDIAQLQTELNPSTVKTVVIQSLQQFFSIVFQFQKYLNQKLGIHLDFEYVYMPDHGLLKIKIPTTDFEMSLSFLDVKKIEKKSMYGDLFDMEIPALHTNITEFQKKMFFQIKDKIPRYLNFLKVALNTYQAWRPKSRSAHPNELQFEGLPQFVLDIKNPEDVVTVYRGDSRINSGKFLKDLQQEGVRSFVYGEHILSKIKNMPPAEYIDSLMKSIKARTGGLIQNRAGQKTSLIGFTTYLAVATRPGTGNGNYIELKIPRELFLDVSFLSWVPGESESVLLLNAHPSWISRVHVDGQDYYINPLQCNILLK